MKLPGIRESLLSPLIWSAVAAASLGSTARARDQQEPLPNGSQADFPVVVGAAYQIGSTTFVPSDSMNFDSVGYAVVSGQGGSAVSAGHHTLPVPSYAEVTDIRSGRTILVRVDHRGPADAGHAIELSSGVATQLGLTGGDVPVRVRRVNPPEAERALLRSGHPAPERMATPKPLLDVLQRKLNPALTQRSLASDDDNAPAKLMDTPKMALAAPAPAKPAIKPAPVPKPLASPVPAKIGTSSTPPAGYVPSVPVPVAKKDIVAKPPLKAEETVDKNPTPKTASVRTPAPKPEVSESKAGALTVQAGAFADKKRAQLVADKIGGTLQKAGAIWRVRVGSYETHGSAEAALAKVKSAGYSDARIQRAQ